MKNILDKMASRGVEALSDRRRYPEPGNKDPSAY